MFTISVKHLKQALTIKRAQFRAAMALASLMLVGFSAARGAELKAETLREWNRYVEKIQIGLQAHIQSGQYLWIDGRPSAAAALKQGAVEVVPAEGNGAISISNGLIHHWIGAVFIPNTSLSSVEEVTRDYSHYKEFFRPEMIDSRTVRQSGDNDDYYLRWVTKVLFVSAGVNAECTAHTFRLDEHRSYQVSSTTKVEEIRNFGKSEQQQLAPDQGDGFVWRLFTITRYEARDGGVYMEFDASALTRDIPGSVRLFVAPIVKKLSRNALLLSLQQTRDAVLKHSQHVNLTQSASLSQSTPAQAKSLVRAAQ